MRNVRKKKIKKNKQLLSFSICVVYVGTMKITHTSYFICDIYEGILKKKEVVSYASVR